MTDEELVARHPRRLRALSLFSGYGGMDRGLEQAGIEVVGQCEIDKDCIRVLEHHWPNVRRWTDVRAVNADSVGRADEADTRGQGVGAVAGECEHAGRPEGELRIDIIVGGFPCQDVSVAGKRAGLDGARSGLWFEFHRIVRELRPKYVLVENVPGLLSSNEGRDFAVILDGLGELGFAVSWAVLDSQHFGVPQRRRRVFIVAGPSIERTEAVLAIAEGCGGILRRAERRGKVLPERLRTALQSLSRQGQTPATEKIATPTSR